LIGLEAVYLLVNRPIIDALIDQIAQHKKQSLLGGLHLFNGEFFRKFADKRAP
jgi:hypothetical protein